mgnify:CR=1 FL=1
MNTDPLQIVRELLIQPGTDLSALVGGRVYFPHLPDNPPGGVAVFDNTAPGVLLVGLGGEPLAQAVGVSVDVEIRCFGGGTALRKTARDAWACYSALRDALVDGEGRFLSMVRLVSGTVISVDEETTGSHAVEPGLNWPFVSSNWTFEVSAS